MNKTILNSLLDQGVIAIVRGVKSDNIINTVGALYRGGISAIEVTFDQKSPETIEETLESIRLINSNFGDEILLGVGTVLNAKQVEWAVENGAKYILTPNVKLEVIHRAKELGCVVIPGALTPSEIVTAYDEGADIIKIFPANSLGTDYIKAIKGPLGHILYFAVGGISLDNMNDYMEIGIHGFGIGSNLVNLKAIKEGRFEYIEEQAKLYSETWNKLNS